MRVIGTVTLSNSPVSAYKYAVAIEVPDAKNIAGYRVIRYHISNPEAVNDSYLGKGVVVDYEQQDQFCRVVSLRSDCPVSPTIPCEDYDNCHSKNHCHMKG